MWRSRNSLLVGVLVGLSVVPLLAQVVRSNATQFPSVSVETNGSEGTPSFTFVSAPTKGFFRLDASSVGISGHLVPGTTATYDLGSSSNTFRNLYLSGAISGSGVAFGNGTAGSPSITFTSAPTKGFYREDANTIGISGFLAAGADATYDFGLAASKRFRNAFFSGIVAGAKVQVGAGAVSTTNITLRSSDTAGMLSVRLGDESDWGDIKARAIIGTSYLQMASTGTQPACSVTYRGAIWFVAGATGVADQMQMCGRAADGVYSWVTAE